MDMFQVEKVGCEPEFQYKICFPPTITPFILLIEYESTSVSKSILNIFKGALSEHQPNSFHESKSNLKTTYRNTQVNTAKIITDLQLTISPKEAEHLKCKTFMRKIDLWSIEKLKSVIYSNKNLTVLLNNCKLFLQMSSILVNKIQVSFLFLKKNTYMC